MDMTEDEVKTFLSELSALSLKFNIAIGGCGCCGSPYLYRPEEGETTYKAKYICAPEYDLDEYENLSFVVEKK